MTDQQQAPKAAVNPNLLVVVAAVVVVVTIGAIVAVALAIEDGARATTMVGLVAAPLTTLLGFLGLFVTVQSIKSNVAKSLEQTTALTNGLGSAQARLAIAEVLPDHLIDPAIHEQLAKDRLRRTAAAEAAAALVEPHAFPEADGL